MTPGEVRPAAGVIEVADDLSGGPAHAGEEAA